MRNYDLTNTLRNVEMCLAKYRGLHLGTLVAYRNGPQAFLFCADRLALVNQFSHRALIKCATRCGECLSLEVESSLTAKEVIATLERLV